MSTRDGYAPARWTRRRLLRDTTAGAAIAATRAVGVTSPVRAATPGRPLKVAMSAEPFSLDVTANTDDGTTSIMMGVFEELFALDANLRVHPMLVESYTLSPDGRTYTFTLRRGVPFHDGSIMGPDDVIASLNRWGKVGPRGPLVYANLDSIAAVGPDKVMLRLKAPFAPLPAFLAYPNGAPAIIPKAIADATGTNMLKQYVGTGPYRFVEWVPDRYIRLAKFDRYAARTESLSGYAGRRTALVDEIEFYPVQQVATRIAGVQSGDYDIAVEINLDAYTTLAKDPRVVPEIVKPGNTLLFFLNKKQGLMSDVRMRRAALAALNMQEILQAAFGNAALYALEPSVYPLGSPWHTIAGASAYDARDPGRAGALLSEAGYTGQPVRWLATTDWNYQTAFVASTQLQRAGFKVDLQVSDWATVLSKRAKPDQWEVFTTGGGFPPDPSMETFLSATYPGWWDNPEKNRLYGMLVQTTDPRMRLGIWSQLQTLMYTDVPILRPGNFFGLVLRSRAINGLQPTFWLALWNVSKT